MQEINRVVTEQTGEVGYFQDSVARADIMAIKNIMGAGAIEDGSIDIISSVNNTNKLVANMSETKAEKTELDKEKGDCVSIEANKADKKYVDELVASKMLTGAGVDTSTLVFTSEMLDRLSAFYKSADINILETYDSFGTFSSYFDFDNCLYGLKLTDQFYSRGGCRLHKNYYEYNGFTIKNVTDGIGGNDVGLIYARNENGLYFMHISNKAIGKCYFVNTSNNGATSAVAGTEDKRVINVEEITVVGLENGVLTIKYKSNDTEEVLEIDMSGETVSDKVIGFVTYSSSEASFKIKVQKVLFAYVDKTLFNLLDNKVNKLSDIVNKKQELPVLDYLISNAVNTSTAIKIKLLGDSITAGYGGTGFDDTSSGGGTKLLYRGRYENIKGHCWANSFKDYIQEKFSNVTVKNYGVSGASSTEMLGAIDNIVEDDDDIVICMIGTNDRNAADGYNRLYVKLQGIVDYCLAKDKKLVLMSNIPAGINNENDNKSMHMEDVDMIVGAIAKKNKIEWVSVYKLFNDYCSMRNESIDKYLGDDLHPTDEGYDVMFYLICNALGFATKRIGATW